MKIQTCDLSVSMTNIKIYILFNLGCVAGEKNLPSGTLLSVRYPKLGIGRAKSLCIKGRLAYLRR